MGQRARPKDLLNFVTTTLKYPLPRLLISVTGGAGDFQLPTDVEDQLKSGLRRAAEASDACRDESYVGRATKQNPLFTWDLGFDGASRDSQDLSLLFPLFFLSSLFSLLSLFSLSLSLLSLSLSVSPAICLSPCLSVSLFSIRIVLSLLCSGRRGAGGSHGHIRRILTGCIATPNAARGILAASRDRDGRHRLRHHEVRRAGHLRDRQGQGRGAGAPGPVRQLRHHF